MGLRLRQVKARRDLMVESGQLVSGFIASFGPRSTDCVSSDASFITRRRFLRYEHLEVDISIYILYIHIYTHTYTYTFFSGDLRNSIANNSGPYVARVSAASPATNL